VVVHYSGWTTDGKLFDSSLVRGEPARFGVTQVIAGWTETLELMVPGEQRRVWIPASLAYGDTPIRAGAPAGMLVFDIELLEIPVTPPVPQAPLDVAAPPANSAKTKSGLRHRVLTAGTGKLRPQATERVVVHYSGWTTNGELFDSSVVRGEPATFGIPTVIPGFAEGVQLMVVGEKRRLWIPGKLAYGDKPERPGAPAGMLVFDVELLEIQPARAPAPRDEELEEQ
jgi:FKBP-type peptidyl-prolyl cis-trans isomerase